MKVTEIFLSIQGESGWAGYPCVFVRATGCHLRCVWCDTDYAFFGGREMSVNEIVEEIERLGRGCRLAEITGGEPLLQKDVVELAEALLERGYTVLCETSGSLDIDALPAAVVKIMDLKCPGSGEADRNLWENLEKLSERDEVKFVIAGREDYEWALEVIEERGLAGRRLLFAPVHGTLEPRQLAEWMLTDNVPARLQLQLHKSIWSPEEVGV
ncbi:MAG: radical SAM protein [Gemmatimonadetes bacterium]|uniref:7-carboxy-7-deazaguanine synthase n=1 Tax=Candidatus Kutchimonas denitrificans TaxID=3056748 RepID=A0AAE5CBP7_9BACT|nr:radical SAM protein [Gemmatimonadota bacterium]NIR74778.1 radical SAM protein [Candidatus Kutchimonas denitrificans]NIS01528.1 radical SAM protein [Gemmatimonadota bacterium]NIT67269.1 radical SAM protein [Gemmatimonadota bacterium]NIU52443.1 radical SAM protein [Gemmatimonadota bacterium]